MAQQQSSWREEIGPFVRTQQIIVLALTAGLLTFSAVAYFAASRGKAPAAGELPILTLAALAFAVMAVSARLLVIQVLTRAQRTRIAAGKGVPDSAADPRNEGMVQLHQRFGDAGLVIAVHQMRTILSAAILEGAGFFCLVAYMIEHSPWTLAMGLAVALAVCLHFPTQNGMIHWVEDELKRVDDARMNR